MTKFREVLKIRGEELTEFREVVGMAIRGEKLTKIREVLAIRGD
jgi:hypothetical protein